MSASLIFPEKNRWMTAEWRFFNQNLTQFGIITISALLNVNDIIIHVTIHLVICLRTTEYNLFLVKCLMLMYTGK